MGQVGSRLDDAPAVYLRDSSRCTCPPHYPLSTRYLTSIVTIQSIQITDGDNNEVLMVNLQEQAGKLVATTESKRPIEFIQVRISKTRTIRADILGY